MQTTLSRPEMHFRAEQESDGSIHSSSFVGLQHRHARLPLAMRREFYTAGISTGTHRHLDFLALYAVRGGRGVHRINGAPYGITRGDVYLMPSGATHEYADYERLAIDAFYFQTGLFRDEEIDALRSHPGFWSLFVGEAGLEHRLHLAPEAWGVIETELDELYEEAGRETAGADLLLRGGLFRLLVHLARQMETEGRHANGDKRRAAFPAMAEALRFCEEHFAEEVSVPQLAARLFLSPGHFSELFSREVGMPPAAYLRRLRLEKARALLRQSELSATQIALQTGFGDAAHFSRAFRAAYGVSPSQYRKRVLSAEC